MFRFFVCKARIYAQTAERTRAQQRRDASLQVSSQQRFHPKSPRGLLRSLPGLVSALGLSGDSLHSQPFPQLLGSHVCAVETTLSRRYHKVF